MNDAKRWREALEATIAGQIREFEEGTGMSVSAIDVDRDSRIGDRNGSFGGVRIEVVL